MKFIDFIEEEHILLELPFISKKRLFECLAQHIAVNEKEQFTIYQSFVDREKMGNTALNNGVAMPHGKCLSDSDDIRVIVARLAHKADYEGMEEVAVQVIVAMAFPEHTKKIHQEIMAEAVQLFKQHRLYRALLNAESKKQVLTEIMNTYQSCNS